MWTKPSYFPGYTTIGSLHPLSTPFGATSQHRPISDADTDRFNQWPGPILVDIAGGGKNGRKDAQSNSIRFNKQPFEYGDASTSAIREDFTAIIAQVAATRVTMVTDLESSSGCEPSLIRFVNADE